MVAAARPSYNLCKALVIVVVLIATFPYKSGLQFQGFSGNVLADRRFVFGVVQFLCGQFDFGHYF